MCSNVQIYNVILTLVIIGCVGLFARIRPGCTPKWGSQLGGHVLFKEELCYVFTISV